MARVRVFLVGWARLGPKHEIGLRQIIFWNKNAPAEFVSTENRAK
jgi:hypothetical protein